jgi:hypothetical protein
MDKMRAKYGLRTVLLHVSTYVRHHQGAFFVCPAGLH